MILTPTRLLSLALAAQDAYAPQPHGIVLDAGRDIRVVLTEMDGYLVIAGRGTVVTDVDNILTDLDALPAYHTAIGLAPRGFLNAALSLMPLLGPYLSGRSVIATGHSLAGSFMALVVAMLVRSGRAPAAYAFFEPACAGEDALVKTVAEVEGYISWFGNDPIPLLPPAYKHPCLVTAIGHDRLDAISCHFIAGVVAWLRAEVEAREAVAA